MPEIKIPPIECPNCGGSHAPGACPESNKDEIKPERVLTPEEKKERDEMQEELENWLSHGDIPNAEFVISSAEQKNIALDLSKSEIVSACQMGLEIWLSHGDISNAEAVIFFAEQKAIALDLFVVCEEVLEYCLSSNEINEEKIGVAEDLISWAEKKHISLDFSKPEIASACQKWLEYCLSNGSIDAAEHVISLAEKTKISLDFFKPEISMACQEGLEYCLSLSHDSIEEKIGAAEDLISWAEKKHISLDFSKPEIASACQEGLEYCLSNGSIDAAEDLISWAEKKNINMDVSAICQKWLTACFSRDKIGKIDIAEQIISLAEKKNINMDVSVICQKWLEYYLSTAWIDGAEQTISLAEKKNINLDFLKPEISAACQKGLKIYLFNGWINGAKQLISLAEKKNISLDFSKPEISAICQKALECRLLNNNVDAALEINRLFLHLSPEKAFALYSHHLPLQELKDNLPGLVEQAKKSTELFFALFLYREHPETLIKTVKENQFLLRALQENPRFAPKLILKYPKFDKVSQAKIQFLFESKKAILKNNPNLDPESLEFRQAIQANLLDIDRNREIVGELAKAGLNTAQWLGYEETEYFTLKSGEVLVPFSERVRTPLDRLGQTIGSYAHQIKNVLSDWRNDLLKMEIEPASVEEDKAIFAQMEEELAKVKEAGDEKKAQGLGRGLEAMRQKTEQAKKIPLWDRLMSEIDNFAKLKESLVKSQEDLILLEQKYEAPATAGAKSPSGVELSKLKSKIAQAKEDFRKRLGQLERRLETFRADFPVLITGLGKDRAISLEQELNEKMAEQFSHYDSDRQTLEYLFSETAEKEKEKLEGRAMSVFVWARNPDIDLYQGNYSSCCISIEQTGRGSAPDSAIADYSTDLGIQIVNIYDEQKNEPVTAAWCWIGIDENGKTALVVDNIEANKIYNSNFPIELWSELRGYLERYARAIGVNRLVLGKEHNDLLTAPELNKFLEAGAQYSKLGGQNSRPNGYFLEAKEKSVKLLWEKGAKTKKIKEKDKQPKIELNNIRTEELSEKDFVSIIKLEGEVHEEELARGQEMITELQENNGLKYSATLYGKRVNKEEVELLGYLVAYEDKTDEGEPSVYLDDIAIAPDAQGQGLGWKLLQKTIERLKVSAQQQNKPVFFDMHLRETSQGLFEKHREELKELGVDLVESALVPDYYDEGEDALYCVYQVENKE